MSEIAFPMETLTFKVSEIQNAHSEKTLKRQGGGVQYVKPAKKPLNDSDGHPNSTNGDAPSCCKCQCKK